MLARLAAVGADPRDDETTKPVKAEHTRVHPPSVAAWRRWLRENHATARGVWLVAYRAAVGKARLSYEDSITEALVYGWIDSLNKPLGEDRTMMLFTPRRPGSAWSRSNKERVARLIREGRMRPAGLAKVAEAKRNGSWTLQDRVDALEAPADLRKALGRAGMLRFEALTPGRQREHLRALVTAKRPETRSKRIALIVDTIRDVQAKA